MARRKKDLHRKRNRRFCKGGKGRKALVISACVAAGLVLLGVIGYYQLLGWLQGDGFRNTLANAVRNKAQAERVEVPGRLSINGSRVSLPAVRIDRKGAIASVSAKRIGSELDRSRLLHRQLMLNKLTVEELTVMVDSSRSGEELPKESKGDGGFLSRFVPNEATLNAFECKDTDVGMLLGGKPYALAGVSVAAHPLPKQGEGTWQVNLENGRLRTPLYYLQDCSIKNATVLFDPKAFNLSECRILLTPGELRAKGVYQRDSGRWSGTLRAHKANVARLLKGDWKKRLTGELYGELEMAGANGDITSGKGVLALQQGNVEGLPILSSLGFGENRPYRSFDLEKAECRINFPYKDPDHNIQSAWLFDQIDIRAKGGLLMVRGHVIIGSDQSLGGTLRIGVPESLPATFGLDNETIAQLFTGTGENGFLWLNMNLSGTLDDPREDLSVRLTTILGNVVANAANTAAKTLMNILPGIGKKNPVPILSADGGDDADEEGEQVTPKTGPGNKAKPETNSGAKRQPRDNKRGKSPEADLIDSAGGIIRGGLNSLF